MTNFLQSLPRDQMVAHSIISAGAVNRELLPNYRLDAHECILLARGINDTYLVSDGVRRFVLRLYRANWRTTAEIEAELELIGRLDAYGLSVSTPIPDPSGRVIHQFPAPEGPRPAVLFSFAEGRHLDREDPGHLALLGRFAADLHRLLEDLPVPLRRPDLTVGQLIEEPMRRLRPYLKLHPVQSQAFEHAAAVTRERLLDLFDESLLGICHGDLHTRNAHVGGQGILTVFDFDLCGRGWRCFDFASVLRDIGGYNAVWDAFINAYTSVRPLSAEEERAIPLLWLARTIWELGLQVALIDEIGYNRVAALIEFERVRIDGWLSAHCRA